MLSEFEADSRYIMRVCLKTICILSILGWVNMRGTPPRVLSGEALGTEAGSYTLSTHYITELHFQFSPPWLWLYT